jgi:hypothetical protein
MSVAATAHPEPAQALIDSWLNRHNRLLVLGVGIAIFAADRLVRPDTLLSVAYVVVVLLSLWSLRKTDLYQRGVRHSPCDGRHATSHHDIQESPRRSSTIWPSWQ